jgi:hypothetical protein
MLMEENLVKLISHTAVLVMLLAAISLFFILFENCENILSNVNRAITDKGVVYQTSETCEEKIVSGAEITGMIRNGPETDIYINSVHVPAHTDADSFDYSVIDISASYAVEYVFSPAGETESIKFIKR